MKIHAATAQNDIDTVRLLLLGGEDANAPNLDGWTPLHIAAFRGYESMARLLIEAGAGVNILDGAGHTALDRAFQAGNKDVSELLRAHGAKTTRPVPVCSVKIKKTDPQERLNEQLSWKVSAAKVFVSANKTVEESVKDTTVRLGKKMKKKARFSSSSLCNPPLSVRQLKRTPETELIDAITRGNRKAIKNILAGGYVFASIHDMEESPMGIAIIRGDTDTITLFLDHGVDINSTDTYGRRPLFAARSTIMLEWLIAQGAQFDVTDRQGLTPLHWMACNGSLDCAKKLLELGVDPNRLDERGCSPFFYAAKNQNARMVSLFLGAGAKIYGNCVHDLVNCVLSASVLGRV